MKIKSVRSFFFVTAAIAAALVSLRAAQQFTEEQLKARFAYDLGPDAIDVSPYPAAQQSNYELFARTCGQCHTLARPINAPFTKREDWNRYIHRMHIRAKENPKAKTKISREEGDKIVDFLVYDAQLRKVQDKENFDRETAERKKFFAEVQKARARVQTERDAGKAKEPAPYTGTK